jgi:PPE-repeat protein
MRRPLILTGVLVVFAGCSIITGPDTRRVIGTIDASGTGIPTIVAPDTVQAGSSFTATIHSFGSSSCTTPDGVALTLLPSEARVTPYDLVPADGPIACTADFAPRPHPVELRFTSTGPATIVALGQVFHQNGQGLTPGTVTKQLVVVTP